LGVCETYAVICLMMVTLSIPPTTSARDDAIGDLGNIEEGTADVDVLLDVKSVLPRPPHFDVDDSGPFGNQTDATPPPPPIF
jgi:hypothetical protein